MTNLKFDKEITALLLIDPYNASSPRAANYGIVLKPLPRRMTASLTCCSC
jgi:hypothetical protein